MSARQQTAALGKRRRLWLAIALVAGLFAGLVLWAAHWALNRGARTPSEVMVYVEGRLEGHTRLETLAAPALNLLKYTLGSEAEAARLHVLRDTIVQVAMGTLDPGGGYLRIAGLRPEAA